MKRNKLIAIRKSKKISQADIATYLKISQTQYQKRETGKIKISDSEWRRIAELLGTTVEDIYEDAPGFDDKKVMEEIVRLKEKIESLEKKVASGNKTQ